MFQTASPSIIRSLRLYIQHQICHTGSVATCWPAATEPVWYDVVCTVLDSWWWTERPSETCRVLFQNKINLRYCASGWFYYRNILRCTVQQTSNLFRWNFQYNDHALPLRVFERAATSVRLFYFALFLCFSSKIGDWYRRRMLLNYANCCLFAH